MCSYLVKSSGPWGGFYKADFAKIVMDSTFDGSELGLGRVGIGDDGLTNINPAGLVFAESVQGLVDQPEFGGATMNQGKVGFMNLPALLHFAQKGGVLLSSGNQEEAGGFAVETAD